MLLDYFIDDKGKLLQYLLSISSISKGEYYFTQNQQEIANSIHFSKQKTNELMQQLQAEGFIELLAKTRGEYHLTKRAVKVLRLFEKQI